MLDRGGVRAPRDTKRSRAAGVLERLGGDQLQRDGAVEVELARAVDDAHAAAADQRLDPVSGELAADLRRGHEPCISDLAPPWGFFSR